VVFTFPMLPPPYPLSGSCLLLLLYMPSPCGDTHFCGQQQWRNHSASPVISWKLPLALSSAAFPLQHEGAFLCSHRCLQPWILPGATKKCHFCWCLQWQCGCPHTYTDAHNHFFPQTLFRDTHVHTRGGNLLISSKGKKSCLSI